MNMQKILMIINSCTSLRKMAKENLSESRITQLNAIIFNSLNNSSTIEQLYIGLEVALSSLEKIVEFANSESIGKEA